MFAQQNFVIKEKKEKLQITRSWFSGVFIIMLLFSIVFLAVGAYIILDAYRGDDFLGSLFDGLWFVIMSTYVGSWLFYLSLCNLINKTVITVTSKGVFINFLPIPSKKSIQIKRSAIQQLFVKEVLVYDN
ncbi:MAG: hypothetical protein JJT94_12665, partial [Bernardetiaceae bacterium]|nr:hypothetical protein [Bernardetiaceae bacterium]